MPPTTSCGISPGFPGLFPTTGQVAHVLLTRSPLGTPLPCGKEALARLACIRRAASVNPEPGSNSPSKKGAQGLRALSLIDSKSLSHSSVVKVPSAPATPPPKGAKSLAGRNRTGDYTSGDPPETRVSFGPFPRAQYPGATLNYTPRRATGEGVEAGPRRRLRRPAGRSARVPA